ncbi:alpha/beta fold hydrolase [Terriglobus tenax]|uniref:alpha/beta fold hydrolase n=1 Tax=Terriglobus tenax TaxID=1111115 RepID=UPI0021DF5B00|nr:alpha/beta fold hydrolase [Terriglobus tenax]
MLRTFGRIVGGLVLVMLVLGAVFYLRPLWVSDQLLRFKMWRQGVKNGYVTLEGHRIHYVEAGPANGKPLLLIHGLGSRIEDWAELIPRFAGAGYHVYAPDLLGYGRSEQPRDSDYSIGVEEQVVVQYMDAMQLRQPDVLGWSMGGWIAMRIAVDHPLRVRRLGVYDTAGLYFPVDFSFDSFTPKSVDQVADLLRVLEPVPAKLPDFVSRDVVRKAASSGWVTERSIHAMTIGRELMDFRLDGLKQPTLIVWGKQDHLIPLETGVRLQQLVPQARLEVVDGCGHLAPRECPVPVFEATKEFLASEPATAGGRREWPR